MTILFYSLLYVNSYLMKDIYHKLKHSILVTTTEIYKNFEIS
jgi:hypothetical protein